MILLILGMILWIGAHYFKRLKPDARAALGTPGKGIIALLILASLALIILGYRSADFIPVWSPPAFARHMLGPIMLLAFWVFGSSAAKGAKAWPASRTRHPQLLAVKLWAFGHLLANGDLASIILFGGMLAWAVGSVILINRNTPAWTSPAAAERPTYIRLAIITLVLFALTVAIHTWLGVFPFGS